jgi:hypothetical protein
LLECLAAILATSLAAVAAAVVPASAADMTAAEIKTYAIDVTQYVELGAGSVTGQAGQGVIYRSGDGNALYRTPTGAIWTGTWEFKGDSLCSTWKQAPTPGPTCSRYEKTGDTVSVLDATTGALRVKIVKTAPGNAEKLAP